MASESLSLPLLGQLTSGRTNATLSFLRSDVDQSGRIANVLEDASKNAASLANVGQGVGQNINKSA